MNTLKGGNILNTIEETIKSAPLLKRYIWREQIELVKKRMKVTGEDLIAVAYNQNGKQHLYVAEEFIYFNEVKGMLSNSENAVPLSRVTSVTCTNNGLVASLTIFAIGTTVTVRAIPIAIAEEVANTIETLRKQKVPSVALQK